MSTIQKNDVPNERADATAEFDLLIQVARRYYEGEATQAEIAEELGLSRIKVSRLLRQARDEGIVDVRIRLHRSVARDLEARLKERFGIETALIAIDHRDEEKQRREVAVLVADYFEQTLYDGAVVAVGMGRNVAAVADTQGLAVLRLGTFVCGTGGASKAGEPGNADHICRKLARRFGGVPETLYAPAFVPDHALRDSLLQNQTVKQTFDLATRADFALIGVGDLGEESHMMRMGWFRRDEILEARASGVVGDLMGYDFFDIDGNERNELLGGRVIGLRLDDLRRIPRVIAVASEPTKMLAILAALRTGAVDVIATSLSNVHGILALDEAMRGA
ncbi:sugar-binding transcriptional regulator [Consotaella salsifontis]|nr:sugar-binding transcriptional regulator [Consotaella salsifontis]